MQPHTLRPECGPLTQALAYRQSLRSVKLSRGWSQSGMGWDAGRRHPGTTGHCAALGVSASTIFSI
eukprot:366134-Chlamydomonas_euryale.AAC.15